MVPLSRTRRSKMINMTTLFEKIAKREIPATFVYEDEEIFAIHDIHPLAPVHVLIISKKPIPNIAEMKEEDAALVGKMFLVARDLARDLNISEEGYKLLIRVGKHGGQEVPHLHLHLIGGAKLTENIHPL